MINTTSTPFIPPTNLTIRGSNTITTGTVGTGNSSSETQVLTSITQLLQHLGGMSGKGKGNDAGHYAHSDKITLSNT